VCSLAFLSAHRWRAAAFTLLCVATAAYTGAHTRPWGQCSTDTSSAAIAACTAIILLDPQNDGALVNRGIAYRRSGDIEHAIRDYDEAIRLNPRAADAFNNRGNAFRDQEQFELAIADYDEALRLDPHYAHAYNNRGIIFLETGDLDRAMADFDKAIAEDPHYANALRNRAVTRALRQLNRP
jgi:tetratricopeptide (TPR) repeat protein